MQPASKSSSRRSLLWIFAVLHILILPIQAGTGQAQIDDPYVLLEKIDAQLESGHIKPAGESLNQLKRLIADSPGWDPDGTFNNRLVPDLEQKIRHLQLAIDQLDELYREDWANTEIPDSLLASGDVRKYLDWSTDTVYRLREVRDTIVNQLDTTEKALLYEASSYDRIQTVLETGIVQRSHEFTREVVKRIGEEDQHMRALRALLDNLKRDTVDLVAQREQLTQKLDMSREMIEQYLDALSTMVTEGVGAPADGQIPDSQQVDEVFFTLLNRRIEAMKSATNQTSKEKVARKDAVERYRHYNGVLVRAGVIIDHEASIGILDQLVADLPVSDRTETVPAEAATGLEPKWILMGGALSLALVLGLAWMTKRRHPEQEGPVPQDGPVDLLISDGSIPSGQVEESRRDSPGVR
jgi:hypothetical protein